MKMEQDDRREQFIAAVRKALDFEGVAGSDARVVQLGLRTFTTCPCHTDPTPSMSIDHDLQIGRCWVCMAQGDIFWWVMTQQQICFRDAVVQLAESAGIAMPADLTWTANQLRAPLATTEPDSRRSAMGLRAFQSPRRLRI